MSKSVTKMADSIVTDNVTDNGRSRTYMGASEEDPVVVDLRKRIEVVRAEQEALRSQLDVVNDRLSRYERAVRALTGEKSAGPPKAIASSTRVRETPAKLSEGRLEAIKQAVLAYAKEHEEFRQVDVRTMPGLEGTLGKSSTMALAFNVLRQDNVIRLARQDGNSKWFRLTREQVNAS
jgi:hypothetical protein